MKKDDVQIGGTYVAKVSGGLAHVRIDAESRHGGWDATNIATNRKVRIKSAQRLRRAVGQEDAESPDVQATESPKRYDPDRCATPRCRGEVALTHLGRPLCSSCWKAWCDQDAAEGEPDCNDPDAEVNRSSSDDFDHDVDDGMVVEISHPPDEETEMSKKKKSKKQAKARGEKKSPATKTSKAKKATAEAKPKRISALDAAAQVLKSAGKPMRAQELIAAMAEKGLWSSPNGKTPHATLYAAMQREEREKGRESRFKKVERGLFKLVG